VEPVVFGVGFELFLGILARPRVFFGKNQLEALPDILFNLFLELCALLHPPELFRGNEFAGLFVPGQAAFLVFFARTAGAGSFRLVCDTVKEVRERAWRLDIWYR